MEVREGLVEKCGQMIGGEVGEVMGNTRKGSSGSKGHRGK